MMRVLPNSGPLGDDDLDGERAKALTDLHSSAVELPESLVYYIRALESRLIDYRTAQNKASVAALWSFDNLKARKP